MVEYFYSCMLFSVHMFSYYLYQSEYTTQMAVKVNSFLRERERKRGEEKKKKYRMAIARLMSPSLSYFFEIHLLSQLNAVTPREANQCYQSSIIRVIQVWQIMPPLKHAFWHNNYFELKALKSSRCSKSILISPFLPKIRRLKTSM